MTFDAQESTRLAAAFAEAHEQATSGEWSVWTSNSVRRITAERQQDGGVLSAVTTRDGMPDLHGNNRDRDLASICTLRNNAASASAQLAAAVERVEELEREQSDWGGSFPVSYGSACEVVSCLHRQLDDAIGQLDPLTLENHSLRARLAAVTALCEEACDALVNLRNGAWEVGYVHERMDRTIAAIRAELAKETP